MLTPASEEEVAALVREKPALHAVGSGTKVHHGQTPDPGEDLSMAKLDRIVSHEPGDLVVTVQAGVRLADLQEELLDHNQWLPIDPPYAQATVGGILATNSSGPRRLAYGTMRDLLIGIRVVGPDGTVTRSGGKVVKNVTGYDLHKLHIGAFGTLGIITEATFKVRPRPQVSAVVLFPCTSMVEAHSLLLSVLASSLRPVALEALYRGPAGLARGKSWALVGVEGTRPVLERHLKELRTLYAAQPQVLEGETAGSLWDALRDLPATARESVRVRIAAKPHDLVHILPAEPTWARVGTGLAWLELAPAADLPDRIAQWHARAAERGGYAVVESAPLPMPGREKLPWGLGGNALMRSIREMRDPARKLNPGRMVV